MSKTIATTPRPFLTAQWRWLAVFNYEVDLAILAPYLPDGVELDFDDEGKTYISLVGFLFRDTRVLGCCIPGHRNFEEVNLRFYVVRREGDELRRGVVFIKELAPRLAVSTVARWCYNENYQTVPMRHRLTLPDDAFHHGPAMTYEFRCRGRWNRLGISAVKRRFLPDDRHHASFILEHYWGYCRQRDGGTIEYRVDHPRWQIWPAHSTDIDCDFAAAYGQTFAEALTGAPQSAFLVDGSAVRVYRPRRIETANDRLTQRLLAQQTA